LCVVHAHRVGEWAGWQGTRHVRRVRSLGQKGGSGRGTGGRRCRPVRRQAAQAPEGRAGRERVRGDHDPRQRGGPDMIIGIDPGLTGALGVLAPDGTLAALWDAPTLALRTSRGSRQEYDVPGMVQLLGPYAGPQSHVTIETSQALPGQGVRSMWTTGY